MVTIIFILLLASILVSIFYLFEGTRQKYTDINEDLDSEYHRDFKDWRLEFVEVENNSNEGSNSVGYVVSFDDLSKKEQKFASILTITDDFDVNRLKKAFRNQILNNHPDKINTANKEEYNRANKRCININKAYKTLLDKFETRR